MTNQEALKRSERSQNLKVFHLEDSPWFYVESEEGKICYKVCYNNETDYFCNCGDFARGVISDPVSCARCRDAGWLPIYCPRKPPARQGCGAFPRSQASHQPR